MPSRFAEVLRWLLAGGVDGREHSIAQVVRGAGLKRSYLNHVLNKGDLKHPTVDKIAALATYFGLDEGELVRLIVDDDRPLPPPIPRKEQAATEREIIRPSVTVQEGGRLGWFWDMVQRSAARPRALDSVHAASQTGVMGYLHKTRDDILNGPSGQAMNAMISYLHDRQNAGFLLAHLRAHADHATIEEIEHVAWLSRITIPFDEELDAMRREVVALYQEARTQDGRPQLEGDQLVAPYIFVDLWEESLDARAEMQAAEERRVSRTVTPTSDSSDNVSPSAVSAPPTTRVHRPA
jgi:transcriptional regulator with XRE-family HTH domain